MSMSNINIGSQQQPNDCEKKIVSLRLLFFSLSTPSIVDEFFLSFCYLCYVQTKQMREKKETETGTFVERHINWAAQNEWKLDYEP